MSQLDLFSEPPEFDWLAGFDDTEPASIFGDPDDLWWFQREAVVSILSGYEDPEIRVQLIVLATGLGKTQTFCAVAKHWKDGPVLVLAHRKELVEQARRRLELMTGEPVEVEHAELKASSKARLVVASTDTIKQPSRLQRMGRERFGLIIPDEFHHYVAKTYLRPLEWFRDTRVLGVTATPDRGDEKALGQIVDRVAYVMDIGAGVESGYLVPIRGQRVLISSLDLSEVDTNRGELARNQLDQAMVKAVDGIVLETLRLFPGRRGPCFFPGVRSAEYAAERFNALEPGSAAFVSGETPDMVRDAIVRDFKAGRYRFLCNCMVATEGFDDPTSNMVVMGRPTLSRALYAQMGGRGTRVLPGVVDGFPLKGQAAQRRDAIAASTKPDLMLVDYVGNSGRHSLVTATDILGGEYSEAEVERAKRKAVERPGADQLELLRESKRELEELAKAKPSKIESRVEDFDPFAVMHLKMPEEGRYAERFGQKPATDKQLAALKNMGVSEEHLLALSKAGASKLLTAAAVRRQKGLASFKQLRQLQKYGVADVNIGFRAASAAIDYLAKSGWKKDKVDPGILYNIVKGRREVGANG